MDQDVLTSIVVAALIASITVVGCACTYCRQTRFSLRTHGLAHKPVREGPDEGEDNRVGQGDRHGGSTRG